MSVSGDSGFFLRSAQAEVLVCDDSPTDAAIVRSLLVKQGCKVTIARSGAEALTKLAERSFDLLLLDYEMEGLSGVEVARQLRHGGTSRPYMPVILLTARTAQSDRLEGLQAGATDFITKPFDPLELTARIENHLHTKRLHDRLLATNAELNAERAKVRLVQLALLPQEMPRIKGLSFSAAYLPSSIASGDYYDVIERADGRVVIAIADVSGHGIPSAMHMSVLRSSLRSMVEEDVDAVEIMARLNRVLRHALDSFSFVTFYLAELDTHTLILSQLAAGHHNPLLHDLASNAVEELPVEGTLPLGLDENFQIATTKATLKAGQRLILYTDGVTDEQNIDGEFFSLEGLTAAIRETAGMGLDAAKDHIVLRMKSHSEGIGNQDDATLLIMQVGP